MKTMSMLATVALAATAVMSFVAPALAISNGNLAYCDLETKFYGAPVDERNGDWSQPMAWVRYPRRADFYTLRTSDAAPATEGTLSETEEPTTYTPGQLVKLHLHTHDLDRKYIGLVMYALATVTEVDVNANTTTTRNVQVGTWEVPAGQQFWTPATCKFKAVVHANADIKPLRTTFHFRAPAVAGYGDLTFRVLLKQGEQGKGTFYYPKTDLILKEQDLAAPPAGGVVGTVVRGSARHSCNNVCADQTTTTLASLTESGATTETVTTPTPMACDEAETRKLATPEILATLTQRASLLCRSPMLNSCSAAAPATSSTDNWCFYHSESKCAAADPAATPTPTACNAVDASNGGVMAERLCVCKAGAPVRDEVPPPPEGNRELGTVVKSYLKQPLTLDPTDGTTLNEFIVTQHKTTVSVSAPQDVWVGLAFDAYFMEGAYATIFGAEFDTQSMPKARQSMPTDALSDRPSGWYDAQCQGVANDYCRWVSSSNPYWTCALAGERYTSGSRKGQYRTRTSRTSTASCCHVRYEDDTSKVPCKWKMEPDPDDDTKERFVVDPETNWRVAVPLTETEQPRAIQERILGDHNGGDLLATTNAGANGDSPVTVESVVDLDGITTVKYSRATEAARPRRTYDVQQQSYRLLWATGETRHFAYHKKHVSTLSVLEVFLSQDIEKTVVDPETGEETVTRVNEAGETIDENGNVIVEDPKQNDDTDESDSGATSAAASLSPAVLLTAAVTSLSLLASLSSSSSSSAASQKSRRRRRSGGISAATSSSSSFLVLVACACVLTVSLTTLPGVDAHNWINGRSRALIASVRVPCQDRIDKQPHVQINAGQHFEIEWATGHGDSRTKATYIIVVHSDDYHELANVDTKLMEDYIKLAPESAHTDVTTGKFQKRHVAPFDKNQGVGYGEEITSAHPELWVERDPVYLASSLRKYDKNVKMWSYSQDLLKDDVRVSYVSRKYPWIESISKYMNYDHLPNEVDLSLFTVEARKGPGDYIAHYRWGGYRDCIDINVQPDDVPITNRYGQLATAVDESTGQSAAARFAQLPHTEYRYVENIRTRCRVIKPDADGNYNAQPCLDDCAEAASTGYNSCTAVQMVRYKNHAHSLPYTPSLPITRYSRTPELTDAQKAMVPPPPTPKAGPCNHHSIHQRADCQQVQTQRCVPDQHLLPDDPQDSDMVCYGFKPYRNQDNQVEEDWEETTDLADPKFYSTAWFRLSPGGFVNIPDDKGVPSVPWQFGEKRCLSCARRKEIANLPTNTVPDWDKALTEDCELCPELTLDDIADAATKTEL